jgi:hypothetical protein
MKNSQFMAVLPAILFLAASAIFFFGTKNTALGICFLCLGCANLARHFTRKKDK